MSDTRSATSLLDQMILDNKKKQDPSKGPETIYSAQSIVDRMFQTSEVFDPEGTGYDYASAYAAKLGPDETGHWPSRVPDSGLILKGRKHETWSKTEEGEVNSGYNIVKKGNRYYSEKVNAQETKVVGYVMGNPVTVPAEPKGGGKSFMEGLKEFDPLSIDALKHVYEMWKTGNAPAMLDMLTGGLFTNTPQQVLKAVEANRMDPNKPVSAALPVNLKAVSELAKAVPFFGPMAARVQELLGEGEYSKAGGAATGAVLSAVIPKAYHDARIASAAEKAAARVEAINKIIEEHRKVAEGIPDEAIRQAELKKVAVEEQQAKVEAQKIVEEEAVKAVTETKTKETAEAAKVAKKRPKKSERTPEQIEADKARMAELRARRKVTAKPEDVVKVEDKVSETPTVPPTEPTTPTPTKTAEEILREAGSGKIESITVLKVEGPPAEPTSATPALDPQARLTASRLAIQNIAEKLGLDPDRISKRLYKRPLDKLTQEELDKVENGLTGGLGKKAEPETPVTETKVEEPQPVGIDDADVEAEPVKTKSQKTLDAEEEVRLLEEHFNRDILDITDEEAEAYLASIGREGYGKAGVSEAKVPEKVTDIDTQTGTPEPVEVVGEESIFRSDSEATSSMTEVYKNNKSVASSVNELFNQNLINPIKDVAVTVWKLINDVNRWLDGQNVDIGETRNFLSEIAARADEFKAHFAGGQDYPQSFNDWKEVASDAANWARKAERVESATRDAMGNLHMFIDPFKAPQIIREMFGLKGKVKPEGETLRQIWDRTGFFFNPFDKKWRYELDDSKLAFKQDFASIPESKSGNQIPLKLGDVIDHPSLFEAYPELKDVTFKKEAAFLDLFGSTQGWFDDVSNTLAITPYANDPRSVVAHEIQHYIQSKEGFARGGNLDSALNKATGGTLTRLAEKTVLKVNDNINLNKLAMKLHSQGMDKLNKYGKLVEDDIIRIHELEKETTDKFLAYKATGQPENFFKTPEGKRLNDLKQMLIGEMATKMGDGSLGGKMQAIELIYQLRKGENLETALARLAKEVGEYSKKIADDTEVINNISNAKDEGALRDVVKKAGKVSFDAYSALAGEIESRDVQARLNLTPEERQQYVPLTSQVDFGAGAESSFKAGWDKVGTNTPDQMIKPDDVIVHFGSDKSASVGQVGSKIERPGPSLYSGVDPFEAGRYVGHWFSMLRKVAAEKLPNFASGQQMMNTLRKLVTKDEWTASRIEDFLAGKDRISKEDVLRHIDRTMPEFKDVVLDKTSDNVKELIEEFEQRTGSRAIDEFTNTYTPQFLDSREYNAIEKFIPNYEGYTEPGGTNYREVFVTAPTTTGKLYGVTDIEYDRWRELNNKFKVNKATPDEIAEMRGIEKTIDDYQRAGGHRGTRSWKDGHPDYDEIENPIVRLRVKDRLTVNGEKVLFIEEIQPPTKAQQALMPPELAKRWREIGMKRAMKMAIDGGYDRIAWTTGDMQINRYPNIRKNFRKIDITRTSNQNRYDVTAYRIGGKDSGDYLGDYTLSELDGIIGEDNVKEFVRQGQAAGNGYNVVTLEGNTLHDTSPGVAKVYDVDLANVSKKLGGKVEETPVAFGRSGSRNDRMDFYRVATDMGYSIDDTHAMWREYNYGSTRFTPDGADTEFIDRFHREIRNTASNTRSSFIQEAVKKGYTDGLAASVYDGRTPAESSTAARDVHALLDKFRKGLYNEENVQSVSVRPYERSWTPTLYSGIPADKIADVVTKFKNTLLNHNSKVGRLLNDVNRIIKDIDSGNDAGSIAEKLFNARRIIKEGEQQFDVKTPVTEQITDIQPVIGDLYKTLSNVDRDLSEAAISIDAGNVKMASRQINRAKETLVEATSKADKSGIKMYSGLPVDEAAKVLIELGRKFFESGRRARGMKEFKPLEAAQHIREAFVKGVVDKSGNIRRELIDKLKDTGYGITEAMYLIRGSHPKAVRMLQQMAKEVSGGLSANEKLIRDELIHARRLMDIAKYKTKKEFTFPEDESPKASAVASELFAYKSVNGIADLTPDRAAKVSAAANAHFDWMKRVVKDMLDEGIISEQEFNDLTSHNYKRLASVEELFDKSNEVTLGGKKISVKDSGIEVLKKGKKTDVLERNSDVLALEVFNRAYGRIFRNRANKELLAVARENPDNPFVRVRESKDTRIPVEFRNNRAFVYENGQRKTLFLSPELAKDWLASSAQITYKHGQLLRWLSGSPLLKTFATGINWAFALRNMPRDIMRVWFTARTYKDGVYSSVYNPTIPVASGQMLMDYAGTIRDAFLRKGKFDAYIDEGGGMELLTLQGRLLQRGRHVGGKFDSLQDFFGYFGTTSEIATRLAIRERVIKTEAKARGISYAEASKDKTITRKATFAARDYMDFSQGGEQVKALDNWFPYLNARIQATRGYLRAFKDQPATTLYKVAQLGAVVAGVYIYAKAKSPNTMQALQGDRRMDGNLIIPLGDHFAFEDSKGQKRYPFVMIPLDQGQKWLKAVTEAGIEYETGGRPDLERVGRAIAEFSPTDMSSLPPTLSAAIGYYTNKDLWTGKDIARKRFDKYPEDEWDADTPQAMIDLGKATGMSPDRVKYALEELVTNDNMYAQIMGAGYDSVFKNMPQSKREQALAETLSKTPGVKVFFGVTNPKANTAQMIKDIAEDVEVVKWRENRELDSRADAFLFDKSMERKDVIDYIKQFKDPDTRDRLIERFRLKEITKDMPERDFWLSLQAKDVETRARVYVERMKGSNPSQQQALKRELGEVMKLGGVITPEFWMEVNRLTNNR